MSQQFDAESAIKFLREQCGFKCGDQHSDISRAWAEIEAMTKQARRYEIVRSAGGKMEPAILIFNYGEDLALLSGEELDRFVDEILDSANT